MYPRCTDTMTRLTFVFMCTTSRHTVMSYTVIIITWILGISLLYMHVWFLYSCHMDPRSYYMYYCALVPYSCYMIPLLDMRAVDMRYVESHIYCSRFPLYCSRYIVPVSRYIVLSYQQSSGPVIMLPVSCTVFVLVTVYT